MYRPFQNRLTTAFNLAKISSTPAPEFTQGGCRYETTHRPGYPRHRAYNRWGDIAPDAVIR
jgi:hypothetical protein